MARFEAACDGGFVVPTKTSYDAAPDAVHESATDGVGRFQDPAVGVGVDGADGGGACVLKAQTGQAVVNAYVVFTSDSSGSPTREPLTLRATLNFDSPKGHFNKIVQKMIGQFPGQ